MDLSSYIILFLIVLLGVSIFYVIKFALIILRVQDAIEEGLEIIDERYGSITEVLKIPLYYDSPEIRRVLRDVEATREALLHIARTLSRVEESLAPEDDLG
tara:strand:+ start:10857 stop:11159 length:303 start_codon:yes stop_codon:yes gene_type:complete